VQGLLSLAYFKERPFSIDYANARIVLETPETLEKRKQDGKTAECRVQQEASTSVTAWLSMSLPKPASQNGLGGSGYRQRRAGGEFEIHELIWRRPGQCGRARGRWRR
ncbi:unnamed protein product, partial [Phaeothamnion confervicola]